MYQMMVCFMLTACLVSCTNNKREREIRTKTSDLLQKEQQLLLKEKQLSLLEERLLGMKKHLDSVARQDTLINNPDIVGSWSVTMSCTETNCPGSAIGDTKSEQWNISYQDDHVLAQATVSNKLIRTYSGNFQRNTLELFELRDSTSDTTGARILVRLQLKDARSMEGQREIVREKNCRILYALKLEKQ